MWEPNWNDDSTVCNHGNRVEVDGNCWEVDCVNPVNGYHMA